MEFVPEEDDSNDVTKEKLSKAAKAYLERAQKYDEMISEARAEYTTGMRHLANMMGENPDTFTQADANVCHGALTRNNFEVIHLPFLSCRKPSAIYFLLVCTIKQHNRP